MSEKDTAGVVNTSVDTASAWLSIQDLCSYWEVVSDDSGVSVRQIAEQALVAPARCCLKNIGQVGASDEAVDNQNRGLCGLTLEERVVERAFTCLRALAKILKDEFRL